LVEGAGLKLDVLGASITSLLRRHPLPAAIAASVIVLVLTRGVPRGGKSKNLTIRMSEGPVAGRKPRPGLSRTVGRMRETAHDVFGGWMASLSTSIEQFAVEVARAAAQSLVRAGDAMIAAGFERLAQSLSQIGKV
jgi:hypothetical protein